MFWYTPRGFGKIAGFLGKDDGRVLDFFGRGGGSSGGSSAGGMFSSLLSVANESSELWAFLALTNSSISLLSSAIASSVMKGLNGSRLSFFLMEKL